jgi:outer membrane lipoprotein-sorting protein
MLNNRTISAMGLALLVPLLGWAQVPSPNPPAAETPSAVGPTSTTAPGSGQAAIAGSTPAPEPPTEAEKALDEAIKKVDALTSVSADILQKVEMLGQKFELKGGYHKADNYRTYLKLSLAGLGNSTGVMLQVCDGQTLWDYQQVLKNQGYSRLDLAKVLQRLKSPDFDPELRKKVLEQVGFGGPAALLIGLRNVLRFETKEEGTLDGKPVLILHGKWKDNASLGGPNQAPMPRTAPLPPYVPSIATVWIGQEDGWPYRVLLEGRIPSVLEDTRQIGPDGKPVGRKQTGQKDQQPSSILLSYTNVRLNPELKPETFAFQAPPDAPVMDETDQLLIRLDQALAMKADQRKAEAAKGEVDLPQSIPVPSPAPEEKPAAPVSPPPSIKQESPAPKGR